LFSSADVGATRWIMVEAIEGYAEDPKPDAVQVKPSTGTSDDHPSQMETQLEKIR